MPYIDIGGLTVHYESAGSGPRELVLVHGNFASWRWWQLLLRRPPAGFRVWAPDLRGCGRSARPASGYHLEQLAADLEGLVDALGLERFDLAGHSLGGAVTLQFALDQPRRVRSLSLVATAPAEGMQVPTDPITALAGLVSTEGLGGWLPVMALNHPLVAQAMARNLPGDLHEAASLHALLEDALNISPLAVAGYAQALNRWEVSERLGELRLPVLVLGGALDPLVSTQALERTAAALPRTRLEIWSDVGHVPQLEQPERFHRLLDEFLDDPEAWVGKARRK